MWRKPRHSLSGRRIKSCASGSAKVIATSVVPFSPALKRMRVGAWRKTNWMGRSPPRERSFARSTQFSPSLPWAWASYNRPSWSGTRKVTLPPSTAQAPTGPTAGLCLLYTRKGWILSQPWMRSRPLGAVTRAAGESALVKMPMSGPSLRPQSAGSLSRIAGESNQPNLLSEQRLRSLMGL